MPAFRKWISRMTLYNHFKSGDELALAAMRRRDELFRNRDLRDRTPIPNLEPHGR